MYEKSCVRVMAVTALLFYANIMRDFIEIMSFCGYDLKKAHALAAAVEEEMARVGLEEIPKQPLREKLGGLCGESDKRSAGR